MARKAKQQTECENVNILQPSSYHTVSQPAYFFVNTVIDQNLHKYYPEKVRNETDKHKLIYYRQHTFIAQHCHNLENALYVVHEWNQHGNNVARSDLFQTSNEKDFHLHVYISKHQIETHEIGKGNPKINVLAFKMNGENHYVALLLWKVNFILKKIQSNYLK